MPASLPSGARWHQTILADGPASPHRDRVSFLDIAVFRGHVPGGKNVREEQHLLVGQAFRNLHGTNIAKRHAYVLRLSARVAAVNMAIAEQPG